MTGELSNPLESSMLQQFFTTTAQGSQVITARPTAWAISLHTNSGANEDNTAWTATELSTTGSSNYTRQLVTFTLNSTGTAGTNLIANQASVAWTSWGNSASSPAVTYIAVWDSATVGGGNMLFFVDTNNITVNSTDVVTINATQVTLEMQ